MPYPPADDRLTHLVAQEINPLVDSWNQAFWLAQAVVKSPQVQAEIRRIAAAHAAGEPCGDRNCEACWAATVAPPPPRRPTMPEPEPIATGNPAYDAVYERIRSLGDHLPPSPAHRNAMIWRAVEAALRAGRAATQRRLIAAFQTDPDPGADEAWTRGHRAGLTTAMDALHATPTLTPGAPDA